MRAALFYNPRLLLERVSERWSQRHRLRRLRGTCADWLNVYQIDSLELIELTAAQGARIFYDVGANVGTWTALCRAFAPQAKIFAFEPMGGHVEQFRQRTAGWPDVRLFPVALGRQEETRLFFPASFSDASSFLPLNSIGRAAWGLENREPQRMELMPLDQLVARENLPAPDVLKLDVQGFELEVLAGAEQTLARTRWVLSEVSFKSFYDGQVLFSELAGFLSRHGFEVAAFGQALRPGATLEQADVLFRRRT